MSGPRDYRDQYRDYYRQQAQRWLPPMMAGAVTGQPSGAGVRIGDAERNQAAEALAEHFATGRIDHEEYDERMAAVWTAKTRADLEPMFVDLPHPRGPLSPPPPPSLAQLKADLRDQRRRSRGWRPPWPALVLIGIALVALTKLPFLLIFIAVMIWRPWQHAPFCGPRHHRALRR